MLPLLHKHRLKIEYSLAFAVIVSAVLLYMRVPGSSKIIMVSMLLLSTHYFLEAFTFDKSNTLQAIVQRALGIASSVCIVGLLFFSLSLTGASQMLQVGIITISICEVVLLYYWFTTPRNEFFPLLMRAAILIGISLSALMNLMDRVNLLSAS